MPFSSVADALTLKATVCPDREFIKTDGDWLTYREVHDRAGAIADGLLARGISRGDRIAVIAGTRDESIETFFACAMIGAVFVPINIYLRGDFLRHQLLDSRARLLIVDAAGAAAAADVVTESLVQELIFLDEGNDLPTLALPTTSYPMLREQSGTQARPVLGRVDPLSIIFTSGTTGRSKGCLLSHGYYLSAPLPYVDFGWVMAGDRIMSALPLFHMSAHNLLMKGLLIDDVSVCFEPVFSASRFLDRCAQEKATVTWGMGPMGMMILGQPPREDDAKYPMRLSIWMTMDAGAQLEYEGRFGTAVIGAGYGQTECSPVMLGPVGEPAGRGTMGRACPRMEVRLVDDDDVEVPEGTVGEIVIRPRDPNSMYSGYVENPIATIETWRNLWHHTGDLARRTAHGYFVYVGRKKDSLRRRGENVSSFELECAILKDDSRIMRAAVTAVPSPLGEDDIKATLVLKGGADQPSPAELFAIFQRSLPYFAIPRYVEFRAELPTTPTGRVQKHILRAEGVTESTVDLEALGLTVARESRRC